MTVPVVRKRAKHSKTRSGCRTCRQRHVKCDETRPVCNACSSSNRVCGGYDFVPLPSASYRPRRIVAAIEKGPVIASIELTPFESAAFDYFRLFTVNQLPQKLWWQHVVLDLGRSEPALAHAATALGSMHRSLTLSSQPCIDKSQHEFATGQYSKAMRLMRQYIERGQKSDNQLRENEVVIVLLTSLLFFCLEAYMGRDEQSTMHLRTGLKILYEHVQGDSSPATESDDDKVITTTTSMRSYLDALKYTFVLMDSDLNMVDEEEPYLQTLCLDRLPLAFQNVQSAHIHLDYVATRANLVWRELLTICEGYLEDNADLCVGLDDETSDFFLGCISRIVPIESDDGFLTSYQSMRQDLRNWLNAWATVSQDQNNMTDHLLCQIFFFYVWYRVETWRDATEMLADRFEEQFAHITNLAEKYLNLHQTSSQYISSGSSGKTFSTPPLFSFGTGFVTAMMVIAIKCRISSIRRRCIAIIRQINLQGVFDSAYLAAYLEAIADLEERRARKICGYPEDKTAFEMDDIPEEARLFEPMMLPGRHLNQTAFYTSDKGSMVFAELLDGPGSTLIIRSHAFSR
ncbi:hypothetical protein M409DRAFT_30924 [Zasmidium cellare ATCC 36951]|uniref:Zn(2)-C6 fungal-type domain-containing protein n=1 Tax=Zasmidium cellare ATCC 36951 TaxID=1080233 RepID=A0A6A6BUX8_ZASCE|nr:uncharacterized protein M409DRAFT_30924 [Zasmidium cellare ATCC 36951]KAF2158594.1 hypothetical protein M409DRAFT_30924 [Zasmidium cellare ATCC 36951]